MKTGPVGGGVSTRTCAALGAIFLVISGGLLHASTARALEAEDAARQTARLEGQILRELNLLRADPRAYARHLQAMRHRYDGALLRREPGERPVRTVEGVVALDECIDVLDEQGRPRTPLEENTALARAARDHVVDQGPTGAVGHRGTDGSSSFHRISRHGRSLARSAEVIDYGWTAARDVVIDLLVDDGVADRGHRRALLDDRYRLAGVACGPHARFQMMCVVELAESFTALP